MLYIFNISILKQATFKIMYFISVSHTRKTQLTLYFLHNYVRAFGCCHLSDFDYVT